MKNQILKLFAVLLFISCHSKDEATEVITEDTVHDTVSYADVDSTSVIKNTPHIWTADFEETTNSFKIHKPTKARLDTLSGNKLITLINNGWDSIHLNFIKSSHDTIYVSIPDSETLTQTLGSTGAENYMATTTFTLTEMKGIKYVNYDFKPGDHAAPGVFSRNDFKNFK